MFKNQSGQGVFVHARNVTTGAAVTGDAANITATISKDGGTSAAVTDTNPTEIGAGAYWFDLSQAETNADLIGVFPVSSTSDVIITPAVFATGQDANVTRQLGVAVTPAYQAIVGVYQLAGEQVYAISWLKNGVPVTIASPTIQITTLAASPANLLDTAGDGVLPATVVGASNVAFLSDEDEALTAGVGYRYVVTATIDGSAREFQGTLVLDSSGTAMTAEQVAQAVWRRTSAQLGIDETSAGANSSAALINDMIAVLTDTAAIDTRTQTIAGNVSIVRDELAGLRITGTVEAGGGTTTAVTANFDADLAANALAGRVIVFPNGTLPNRRITANTAGAESTLTFDSALPSAPGDGVEFAVLGYVEPAS